MTAQDVKRLAVELVTVEVLELAIGARRIENAEGPVEIPERPAPVPLLEEPEVVLERTQGRGVVGAVGVTVAWLAIVSIYGLW